jgi:Uma2 family endonuclease
MISNKTSTYTEFEAFIQLPENEDRLFEFINGEVIEKVPGRTRNSEYGHIIATAVRIFCLANNIPCRTSGGDGAYDINRNVVAPDFAYKRTPTSDNYPDPEPPLWAVEIISPTDKAKDIRAKRRIYQAAGILLWEMYPEDKTIDVYLPGQSDRVEYGINDVLNAGDVLPGFELLVKEIFAL